MSAFVTAFYGLALLPYAAFFGIAVYLFLAPCYDKLSGRTFLEFFQAVDPYMKARAPLLSLAQLTLTLALLGLTYDLWATLPFWLTVGALLLGLSAAVVAVWGNVPLNRQMERWSPADPPAGWEQVRDRWLRYHHLRGAAEVAAFVLLLTAALCRAPLREPGTGAADAPASARVSAPSPKGDR